MGQIVRRKRKGRPTNSDRAHRNSPEAPPSPVDRRSSRRRRNVRYNFDIDDYVDDDEFFDDYDVEIGRREKKIRLLCENNDYNRRRVTHAPSSSEDDDDDEEEFKPSKKRKVVDDDDDDDDVDNEIKEIRGRKFVEEEDDEEERGEEEDEEARGSDFICGTVSDIPKKVVSMPDKKTLELILDKLQKKDIYGVYAQPVDPDELPDYYDVIKHPMDFATIRKKLAKGSYLTLKEFENDVLLLCSNAMQYNAPDTIYHRQASSIQEQAKLRFQRLRANNVDRSDLELKTEQKTLPSFSLPKKQLKKSVARTPLDNGGSETFSGARSMGDLTQSHTRDPKQSKKLVPRTPQDTGGSETFSGARSMGDLNQSHSRDPKQVKKLVPRTPQDTGGSETFSGARSTGDLNQSHSRDPKQVKKLVPRTPQDTGGSETFSGARSTGDLTQSHTRDPTVRTVEFQNGSSAQTLSRANSVDVPIPENSSLADNNLDKDQDLLPGKSSVSKLGRKPSVHDENRRATYNIDFEPVVTDSDSIFSTFEGESKQFIPVGLHADHSYARSLARFAATLGSIAWKVASHTIEQALPEGVKYGRGWVGEYEPLSTPVLMPENPTLNKPIFFATKNDEKAAKFTAPAVNKAPKMDGARELPAFFNPRIPVKQESFREAGKNPIPKPLFTSSQASQGLNLQHQTSPQVELNHPPPMHVSAADFVAKRPMSNPSDIPSPRPSIPVSRNGNPLSLGSFKHSNTNNDGFPPGRPSKTAGLDCNGMVPMDSNNMPHRQGGKLLEGNRDSNRMIPIDNMTQRQEGKPFAVNQDSNRMVQEGKPYAFNRDSNKMVQKGNPFAVNRGSNRMVPEGKPFAVNRDSNRTVQEGNPFAVNRDSNGTVQEGNPFAVNRDSNRTVQEGNPFAVNRDFSRMVPEAKPLTVNQDFNRMVPVDNNLTHLQEGRQLAFNRDSNRMVHMDNNINRRQEEQQGLSDPVQMMRMLSEKAKLQMNNSNGFGFGPKREDITNAASTNPQFHSNSNNSQISSKRDDSNNVSLTAAQAWMSLGAGGFVKPPLAENINPHQQISAASLYSRQQPQVTQFPGVQFQQPVKMVNEGQFQNRNVGFPQMVTTDLSRFQGQPSFRGANPQVMQVQSRAIQQESRPPDLNIGYQSMGVDSQQPDLALQL